MSTSLPVGGRRRLNFGRVVLDEVALEGLDGATLPALATRLLTSPSPCAVLRGAEAATPVEAVLQMAWEAVRARAAGSQLRLFRLHDDRPDLVVFNRYDHLDPDLGMVVEPEEVPEDPYPFSLVEEGAEKGSCSSYSTREDVTEEARRITSVRDAMDKFGRHRLVAVASQDQRARALLGDRHCPLLAEALSPTQWCLLERVGRSRTLGEVTQGKASLQFMKESPKTLFYHRKELLKQGLLTKQIHYQKHKGQNFQGTLFHLPRFYVERRSKALILVHNIVTLLKERGPLFAAPLEEVKEVLNLGPVAKKLLKHTEFQRFLRVDTVAYRELFPGAAESEWRARPGKVKEDPGEAREKMVRAVHLLDPSIDPESLWNDTREEMEEDEERGAEGGAGPVAPGSVPGILDNSRWRFDKTMMRQAYDLLVEQGPRGISQQRLGQLLGML